MNASIREMPVTMSAFSMGILVIPMITVRGSEGYAPGEPMAAMNFLDSHLAAMLTLIGVTDHEFYDVSGTDDDPAAALEKRLRCERALIDAVAR
mgnify:CR=1 FL=1